MSLRVVLADDHIVLRQGVRALLERHGLEVVAEASDGRAAVELARQHEPDVAVLDIMMPLLNGIDAAQQIVEACPETQVVMLTALEQERLVTDAVRAGVRGFGRHTSTVMDNSLPDDDFPFPVCRACLTRGRVDPYTVIACVRRNDVTTSSAG